MLLTLAAFAQAPALEPDPVQAGMTCGAAAAATASEATVRLTVQASYFVMQAARADRQSRPFLERFEDVMRSLAAHAGALVQSGRLAGGGGDAILAECDRRFPLARSTAPARLPADPLRRDLTCLGVVSFLEGAAREGPTGGTPSHAEIVRAQAAYTALLDDERMRAAGLGDDETAMRRIGELTAESLDLGNSEAVTRACIQRLDG
jgi:hypothetical protein